MRKISDEEYSNLIVKRRGRRSMVFSAISNLKPGENLIIEKADWKKPYPISRITSYIGKRNGRKFSTASIVDGSGWIVRRIS